MIQAQYKPAPNFIRQYIQTDSLKITPKHDPWFGQDKAKHLVISGLITLSTQYILVNTLHKSEKQSLPISIAHAACWGLLKELYDKKRSPSKYFSKRDLVADGLGILLASALISQSN